MKVGDVIAERFELRTRSAQGGSSTVYRARDRETGGDVAVKALALDGAHDLARFTREASVLLLAGVPHREPIARYGPFVMTTEREHLEAFRDYRSGKLGEITRTARLD